jgi:predicted RNA-binding protein with PUA-like domain
MSTWLLKTEPDEFAYADLEAARESRWDGVSNAQALIHLRGMAVGDDVLIYHTGDEKAIVGLAKVTRAAYEDPAQPGKNARGEPKHAVVDVRAVRSLPSRVTLAQVKADERFAKFPLVKQGRLSVMPVPAGLDRLVRKWGGIAP